jgi:hypothetical protein
LLTLFHEARESRRLAKCPIYSSGLGIDLCDYFDDVARKTNHINFTRSVIKALKVQQTPRKLIPGVDPRQNGIYLVSSGMVAAHALLPRSLLPRRPRPQHHRFRRLLRPRHPRRRPARGAQRRQVPLRRPRHRGEDRLPDRALQPQRPRERNELLDFALRRDPRAIVLNHGDPEARDWFAEEFARAAPHLKITNPVPLTPGRGLIHPSAQHAVVAPFVRTSIRASAYPRGAARQSGDPCPHAPSSRAVSSCLNPRAAQLKHFS